METSNMNEENAREIRPGGQDEKSPVKPVGRVGRSAHAFASMP